MTNLEDLQSFNRRDDSAIYTYDSRNRLESWEDADGIKKWYTYDKLGNLIGHGVDSEGGTNQTFTTVDSTKPHQITLNRRNEDYEYDADGNVIRRWWTHFVYDSANRLVCTGSDVGLCDGPAYRYDADGQLMYDGETQAILMGELFKWRPYWGNAAYSNLVAFGEVIGQARQDNASLREAADSSAWWLPILKGPLLWLLAGAGGLGLLALLAWLGAGAAFGEHPATATLALVLSVLLIAPPTAWGMGAGQPPPAPGDDQVSLFFRNHQGSLVFATNPGGRQAYEPFGKARYSRGERKFTNKQFHFASKMYYFGARWYDAEAGRFASVDPLVAQPENPQQLNAYGYVLNDPANMVDQTGLFTMCTPSGRICWGRGGGRPHRNYPGGFAPFAPNWVTPATGPVSNGLGSTSAYSNKTKNRIIVYDDDGYRWVYHYYGPEKKPLTQGTDPSRTREGPFNPVKFGVGVVNVARGGLSILRGVEKPDDPNDLSVPKRLLQLAFGFGNFNRGLTQMSEAANDSAGPSARNLLGLAPFGQLFDDPLEPTPQEFLVRRFQSLKRDPRGTANRLLREFFALDGP